MLPMSEVTETRCGLTRKQWENASGLLGGKAAASVLSKKQELFFCVALAEQAAQHLVTNYQEKIRTACRKITTRQNVQYWSERTCPEHLRMLSREMKREANRDCRMGNKLVEMLREIWLQPDVLSGQVITDMRSWENTGENSVEDSAQAIRKVRSTLRNTKLFQQLFLDIKGPFDPVAWVDAWRTETVTKLAVSIYDASRFDELPILADALEEAGCQNAHVLSHCRGPNIHVRGCHVIDGILEKR
jgi:hypothetical protein